MKKVFKLKVNKKDIIHLQISGDDDLVNEFCLVVLKRNFGLFYELKKFTLDKVIEGDINK